MAFTYLSDQGDLYRAPEPADTPETLAQMQAWDGKKWILVTDSEVRAHASWYGLRVNPNKLTTEQTAA